jgi:putative ABC transport system permease protein
MIRKRRQNDFSAEIESHIRLEADRLHERGLSEEEALAAARRRFGNVTSSQERFYESRRWLWWDGVRQDLRLGLRLLAKTPGWTAVAAFTVALGIGAAAAIFSVVNTVLLRPLPFAHPEQLYNVIEGSGKLGQLAFAPDYFILREVAHSDSNSTIAEMGAYDSGGVNWTGKDQSERWVAGETTASFFTTLQVRPLYGRTFLPEEDRPGAQKVALLSYALWQRNFGGDPRIVGQRIRLDRQAALVIGIMPAWFDFPQGSDVWIPIALDEAQQRERKQATRIVNMLARAKPWATKFALNRELEYRKQTLTDEYKQHGLMPMAAGLSAQPLQEHLTGNVRPALLVFSGAVALMLLIVCFTVANLMLARATSRRREIAVRVALGAPRRRIVSQLITESLLISLAGGALGLALAEGALAAFDASRQTTLAGLPQVFLDWNTAGFALIVTIFVGVAFGLAPSAGSLGFGVREALQGESRSASSGRAVRRIRQGLVVAQLGSSLTLLIGAGLLAKSFYQLRNTDPGYRPENVLTARINLAGTSYASAARQEEFITNLLQGIGRLPGVEAAGIGGIPPGLGGNYGRIAIQGQPEPALGQGPVAAQVDVSPDYFRVLNVPLLEGRVLSAADTGGAPLVVVANQAFARKYFPGESALGHRVSTIQIDPLDPGWAEIVAVVGNMRALGLDQDVTPSVYRPYLQEPLPLLARANLLVRGSHDPMSLLPSIEKLVAGMDRDQPVFDAKTMEQRLKDSLGSRRFNAVLTAAFALVAAFLACTGVYGVMSYLVALRTSEIGIRLALGARREQVLALILREGSALAIIGVALGLAGAFALSRYLANLLYDVSTHDLATFIAVTAGLFAAAVAASAIPGRRAANVDPAIALRHD